MLYDLQATPLPGLKSHSVPRALYSNSLPSFNVYTNFLIPEILTESLSFAIGLRYTNLVLLSSIFKVGVWGLTESIFIYAGFVVHSPTFPALSTALTYTNNCFLADSVYSFTFN